MRTLHFYDPETGIFTGRTFSTNIADPAAHAASLAANAPNGCAHIEGDYDHLSQRVDVERLAREDSDALTAWDGKGERPKPPVATAAHVIDHQPAQPSTDHEWDSATKRWVLTAAVRNAQQGKRDAAAEIQALRHESQDHMITLALDPDDKAARQALTNIRARIAVLKALH
jgi:hypothetical protein